MQLRAEVLRTPRGKRREKCVTRLQRVPATFDRREIVQDREIVLHAIYNGMLKDRSTKEGGRGEAAGTGERTALSPFS